LWLRLDSHIALNIFRYNIQLLDTERKNIVIEVFLMSRKIKPSIFQVLLLNNKSQDVEVQESEQVDFSQVKEHLKNGGSVFITSKNTQKISFRKTTTQNNLASHEKTRFCSAISV